MHENIMIIGEFIMTEENHQVSHFMQTFALSCLINKPTCHQSQIATCIDLILRNSKNLFKLSDNAETDLSDHHMFIQP